MKKLFVVGMGHSGTMTMSNVLSCAENAQVLHEEEADPWQSFEILGYTGQDLPVSFYPGAWMQGQKEVMGDSNCFMSPIVRHILEGDKETYFIHLYRDPKEVVAAWMGSHLLNDSIETKPIPPSCPCSDCKGYRWRPYPPGITDQFRRICFYWIKMNEHLMTVLSGARVKLLNITGCTDKLDELWEWLGLRGGKDKAAALSKIKFNSKLRRFPSYVDWPTDYKKEFERILGQSPFVSKIGIS